MGELAGMETRLSRVHVQTDTHNMDTHQEYIKFTSAGVPKTYKMFSAFQGYCQPLLPLRAGLIIGNTANNGYSVQHVPVTWSTWLVYREPL